jgi:hypothetical protein
LIASLLGIENGTIGSRLLVEGYWRSPDSVTVDIDSALVSVQEDAINAALSVATAPIHHVWLPIFQNYEEEDFMRSAGSMLPLLPWLSYQQSYVRFDKHDPYMSTEVFERVRPIKSISTQYRLQPDSTWYRIWAAKGKGVAFEALAWGARTGQGRRETWESGRSLDCDAEFLRRMLTELNCNLVALVELQHYKERDEYVSGDDESDSKFTHSTLVVLIDQELKVRSLAPTLAQRRRIDALTLHERADFAKRLAAVRGNKRRVARGMQKGSKSFVPVRRV